MQGIKSNYSSNSSNWNTRDPQPESRPSTRIRLCGQITARLRLPPPRLRRRLRAAHFIRLRGPPVPRATRIVRAPSAAPAAATAATAAVPNTILQKQASAALVRVLLVPADPVVRRLPPLQRRNGARASTNCRDGFANVTLNEWLFLAAFKELVLFRAHCDAFFHYVINHFPHCLLCTACHISYANINLNMEWYVHDVVYCTVLYILFTSLKSIFILHLSVPHLSYFF